MSCPQKPGAAHVDEQPAITRQWVNADHRVDHRRVLLAALQPLLAIARKGETVRREGLTEVVRRGELVEEALKWR
jgi:hypothetical protein